MVNIEIISKLCDMIEEELEGAELYIKCAQKHKEDHKDLSDMFYSLSLDEMKHMNMLHAQVVNLIEAYRKEHGDPPEKMQWLYNYLHKKHMEKASQIKAMQIVYKE